MCQSKIKDRYGNQYLCPRPDSKVYLVEIVYGSGHRKGSQRNYSRTLCSKHGKPFRHELRQKIKRGHAVNWLELELRNDNYAYETYVDYYRHGSYKHNLQTFNRLKVISSIKMDQVGVAQFGFKGVMSGLYIEKVWSFTDEEFEDYINWALSLSKN